MRSWRRQSAAVPASHLRASIEDPDAFEAFYRANVARVVAFLTRRTLDPQVALDLAAETFALALERRGQFRGNSVPEEQGWLFAIARNQLNRYYRRGDVERAALQRVGLEPATATAADLEWAERQVDLPSLQSDVHDALATLPREQAHAVSQRVLLGRSYSDVAEELQVTEQVVRARVSRGLRALTERLDEYRLQDVA